MVAYGAIYEYATEDGGESIEDIKEWYWKEKGPPQQDKK